MSNNKPSISPHAKTSIELLSKYKQLNSLTSIVHEQKITTLQNKIKDNNGLYPAILNEPKDMNNTKTNYRNPNEYKRSRSSTDEKYKYVIYKQGQKSEYLRKRYLLLSKSVFATLQKRDASDQKNKKELLRASTLEFENRKDSKNWKEKNRNYRLVINYTENDPRNSIVVTESSERSNNKKEKVQTKKFEIYCDSEQDHSKIKDLIFGMRISENDEQILTNHLSKLNINLSHSLQMLSMFKILSVANKNKLREGLIGEMKSKLKDNYDSIKKNLNDNLKKALDTYHSIPKNKKNQDLKIIKVNSKNRNVNNKSENIKSEMQDLNNGKRSLSRLSKLARSLQKLKDGNNKINETKEKQIICTKFLPNKKNPNDDINRQTIIINMKKYQILNREHDVLINSKEISNISNVFKKASISQGYLTPSQKGMVILGPRKQQEQKYKFKYLEDYYKYNDNFFEEIDGNLNIKKNKEENCRCIQFFAFKLKKSQRELEQLIITGFDDNNKPFEIIGLKNPTDIEFKLEISYNTPINKQTLEMKIDKLKYNNGYYYVEINQEIYLSEADIKEYKEIIIDIRAFPNKCYNDNQKKNEQNAFKTFFKDISFGRTVINIFDIENIHMQNKFNITDTNNNPIDNSNSYFILFIMKHFEKKFPDSFYGVSYSLGSSDYKLGTISKQTLSKYYSKQITFYGGDILFKLQQPNNEQLKNKIINFCNSNKKVYDNLQLNIKNEFLPDAEFISSNEGYESANLSAIPKKYRKNITKETLIFHCPELNIKLLRVFLGVTNQGLIYNVELTSEIETKNIEEIENSNDREIKNKNDKDSLDEQNEDNKILSSNLFNELNAQILDFNYTRIKPENYEWYYSIEFQKINDDEVICELLKKMRQTLKSEQKYKEVINTELNIEKYIEYMENLQSKPIEVHVVKLEFFEKTNYNNIKVIVEKENDLELNLMELLRNFRHSYSETPQYNNCYERASEFNRNQFQFEPLILKGQSYKNRNRNDRHTLTCIKPDVSLRFKFSAENNEYFSILDMNSTNNPNRWVNEKDKTAYDYLFLYNNDNENLIVGCVLIGWKNLNQTDNITSTPLPEIEEIRQQVMCLLEFELNVLDECIKRDFRDSILVTQGDNERNVLTDLREEFKQKEIMKVLTYKTGKEKIYKKLAQNFYQGYMDKFYPNATYNYNDLFKVLFNNKTDTEKFLKNTEQIGNLQNIIFYGQPFESRLYSWFFLLNVNKLVVLTKEKIKNKQQNIIEHIRINDENELREKIFSYYKKQIENAKDTLEYLFGLIKLDIDQYKKNLLKSSTNYDDLFTKIETVLQSYFIWASENIHLNNLNKPNYEYVYFEGLFMLTVKIYTYISNNKPPETKTHTSTLVFWILIGLAQIIPFFKQPNPLHLKEEMSIFYYYSNVSRFLIQKFEIEIHNKFQQLNFPFDALLAKHFSSLFSHYFNEDLFLMFMDYIILFSAYGFYSGNPKEVEVSGLRILCAVPLLLMSKNKKKILVCNTVSQLLRCSKVFILKTLCAFDFIRELHNVITKYYDKNFFKFFIDVIFSNHFEIRLIDLQFLLARHNQNQRVTNYDYIGYLTDKFEENVKKIYSLEQCHEILTNPNTSSSTLNIQLSQLVVNVTKPRELVESVENTISIEIHYGSQKYELKKGKTIQIKLNDNDNSNLYFYVYINKSQHAVPNKIKFFLTPSNEPMEVPFETDGTGEFSNRQISFSIVYLYKAFTQSTNNFSAIFSQPTVYINSEADRLLSYLPDYSFQSIDPNAKLLPLFDTSSNIAFINQIFSRSDNSQRKQIANNSIFNTALSNMIQPICHEKLLNDIRNRIANTDITIDEVLYNLVLSNKMELEKRLKYLFVILQKGDSKKTTIPISRVKELIYFLYAKFRIYFPKGMVDSLVDELICKDKKLNLYHVIITNDNNQTVKDITHQFASFIDYYINRTEKVCFTENELCKILQEIVQKEKINLNYYTIEIQWGHNNIIYKKWFHVQKNTFSSQVFPMNNTIFERNNNNEEINKVIGGFVFRQPYNQNEINYEYFRDNIFFNLPYISDIFRLISFFEHGFSIPTLSTCSFLNSTNNNFTCTNGAYTSINDLKQNGYQKIHLGYKIKEWRLCEVKGERVKYNCFEHNTQFDKQSSLFLSEITN